MRTASIVLASLVATLLVPTAHAAEPTSSLIRVYTVGETFGSGIVINKREKPADAWMRTGWDITLDLAYAYQRASGTPQVKEPTQRAIDTTANITIGYVSPSNTGRCLYEGSTDGEFDCLRELVPKYRDVVIGKLSYDKEEQSYSLVLQRFRHTKLLDDACVLTITDLDTDGLGLVVAASGGVDQCIKQMFRNADLTVRNPGNAEVFVDNTVMKQEQLRVSAGKHTITAKRAGFEPFSQTVECRSETPCSITIALRPKEATPIKPPPEVVRRPADSEPVHVAITHDKITEDSSSGSSSMSHTRIALISSGWTTTAVGAAMLITSIIYSLDASEASDAIDSACPGGQCTLPESQIRDLYESGTADEEMSNTLLGVGIGMSVVGLALAITGHVLDDAPEASAEVLISPTWNGLRATVGRDGFFASTGISF